MKLALLALLLMGCGKAGSANDGGCEEQLVARLDRTCAADADCAVLSHQFDCCGSQRVLGVAAKGRVAAQAQEDVCALKFPVCRCATMQPVAEDGKAIGDGLSLKVRCGAGRCASFVD